jgi:hypothetical protein
MYSQKIRMEMAVGEQFEAFGILLCDLLKFRFVTERMNILLMWVAAPVGLPSHVLSIYPADI